MLKALRRNGLMRCLAGSIRTRSLCSISRGSNSELHGSAATVGAHVVVRTLRDGMLGYRIAQVKVGALKQKTSTGAFYFSGRTSVFRRSVRLVIPTKDVLHA